MQTEAYDVMMKFAREQRRENESDAQAFSRFSQSPEGRALLAKHQSEQLADSLPYVTPTVSVEKSAPTLWGSLVASVQKIENCSLSKAIDICLKSPEGREVYDLHTHAERVKSGAWEPADLSYHDTRFRADVTKAKSTTLSEYERLVEETLTKFPQMTRSDAMSRVQAMNPKAWENFKLMMPDGGNPMDAPVSGRPAPAHETMWDSPASGSRQSAGRDVRPGPQPDDSVRFKRDRCAGAIADVFKSIADDEALPTSDQRKEKEHQSFLDHLTRKHAERMGLPAAIARKHIDAISVTARKAKPDPYDGL
jgi:hypothetical protein